MSIPASIENGGTDIIVGTGRPPAIGSGPVERSSMVKMAGLLPMDWRSPADISRSGAPA